MKTITLFRIALIVKITIKAHPTHATPDTAGSVVFDSKKITVTESVQSTPWGDRTVVRICAPMIDGIPWLLRHCDFSQTWLVVKWGRKSETLIFRRWQYVHPKNYAIELLR